MFSFIKIKFIKDYKKDYYIDLLDNKAKYELKFNKGEEITLPSETAQKYIDSGYAAEIERNPV